MTWHQWQAAYPIDRKIGLPSACARSKASGPHGYQSTGLWACCRRYGLVSRARRLVCIGPVMASATEPCSGEGQRGGSTGERRIAVQHGERGARLEVLAADIGQRDRGGERDG